MSATNRGAQRVERDDYPTPAWCVNALLRGLDEMRLLLSPPRTILDPCAGQGAVLEALRTFVPDLRARSFAIDINPKNALPLSLNADHYLIADALSEEARSWARPVDWIVTNPPYGDKEDLARRFVEAWRGRALLSTWLVRLNWLGSLERAAWFRAWMPHVLVLPRRPAFIAVCKGQPATRRSIRIRGCGAAFPLGTTGKCECGGTIGSGTDACEYAWVIWTAKDFPSTQILVADAAWCAL